MASSFVVLSRAQAFCPRCTPTDTRVLLALSGTHGHATPLQDIATLCRVSRASVARSVANLVDHGHLIKWSKEPGGANSYAMREGEEG